MKKALITGITGQDGSYLAEFLLGKGYEVHGIVRRSSTDNTQRISHLIKDENITNIKLYLHNSDLVDACSLSRLVNEIAPDEVYNLGAQSHVKASFEVPDYTSNVDALGALRLLDCLRDTGAKTKYYQASSSELFGLVQETPQRETTPFYPRSPYAVSKQYAYWITVNYREAYNIFACNGILFNHESPRRGATFVTRKITLGIANILRGMQDKIVLGNIDSKRDWGFAGDYVEAMWQMLQQPKPDDFVISTGETHSVREFCELAFKHAGITLAWQGTGVDEKGIDANTGIERISISREFFRPTEVDLLLGDSTKARKVLGWEPKVSYEQLVKMMVEHDIAHPLMV